MDREQVAEEANVMQTGDWWVAEWDDPQLAVIGASEATAREKLGKRWEDYTTDEDHSDIPHDASIETEYTREPLTDGDEYF